MANRIESNVFILDTASGNTAIPVPSIDLIGIGAWFSGATGELQLSGPNTTNVIVRITATGTGNSSNYWPTYGLQLDELKVPVLTAGTAWIYFK